ncbi:ATP-grasp fold amidoligase family protein [Vibrio breoganii]
MKFSKKSLNLVRDVIRFFLTPRTYGLIRFIITHRYIPSFSKPISWNEKIQHRKYFVDPSELAIYVDKYYVREFVSKEIGAEYLIPIIARFTRLEEASFDLLPDEYVMKSSNGGGGVNVFIKKSGDQFDTTKLIRDFNYNLENKLGSKIDELFYDYYDPSIIVEELISSHNSSPLLDYKFHVFSVDGVCTKIFLQINSDYGKESETKTLYDLEGTILDMQFDGYNYGPNTIELPQNFPRMIELAKKLAARLSYARVDLYNVEGKIYFGEITVCPASGWDRLVDKKFDFSLGEFWV